MALLPRFFLDCVVAIGTPSEKETKWIASGFLYGDFAESKDGENFYRVYLVTNRHVFQGQKQVLLRFNPKGTESARQYTLDLLDAASQQIWTSHPNPEIDIAVTTLNIKLLEEQKIQFSWFRSDQHVAALDKMAELGVTEGDFIYTLGFPMGLIGGERNYVIVRSGNIARIQDALSRRGNEILIDALIFPGHSGGPVVTKPEAMAIRDTKAVGAAYLIGVIRHYIAYQDTAISMQTHRPRITFEENSGLAAVIPTDFVQEAIKEYKKEFGNKRLP